jgi:hypothetical protein
MILVINNYTSKWLKGEIKDCGNNFINNNFELLINDEKLKDNHNIIIIPDKTNNESTSIRNNYTTSRNREKENTSRIIGSEFDRKKYKNSRNANSKETNKYNNFQGSNKINYNKKKMYNLSSCSRISESEGRHILLDSCSKPLINNYK